MNATQVQYRVNGTVSTVWNRVVSSKLTYVILGYMAVKAEEKFPPSAFETLPALQAAASSYFPHVLGGVAAILFRSAVIKSELAANALNPDISGVEAIEVEKKGPQTPIKTALALILAASMCGGLTACDHLKQATFLDADGNPIERPTTVGINLGGLFPAPKPSPTPPPIMQAQTPILPGLTVEK